MPTAPLPEVQAQPAPIHESVRDYYGRVLQSSADLKTTACCPVDGMPVWLQDLQRRVHPEVSERFYGCGAPLPPALTGCTVLDLGCGSGRDCYILAQLVGPEGRVIGVDMTAEQLEVARRHQAWHAEQFGYANVEFHQGYIEDLAAAGIAPSSVDVVVSNCVVNLSPDKGRVLQEIFRVLKPGGELYFSDIFSDRRIPANLAADPVLLGECLGGALYTEDFRRLAAAAGCQDARTVSAGAVTITDPAIHAKIGHIGFRSLTMRAFRLPLEDRCEDYGQVATYLGSIAETPAAFVLDDHHLFEAQRPQRVCGNTADMLGSTRLGPHFRIEGNKSRHAGLFDCAPVSALSNGTVTGCC